MLNMYVFHIQLMLVGVNTAVEISSLCIQTLDFQSIYLCVNHLPWCSAWDRFSGCFKSDECSDDGKYTPHINKTMPPKLETEANRNQPHPQQCSSLQIRKDVLVTEVNQYITSSKPYIIKCIFLHKIKFVLEYLTKLVCLPLPDQLT